MHYIRAIAVGLIGFRQPEGQKPGEENAMRTLKRNMSGEDVRLLHAVLNFHLPPPSDQLPTTGEGALDFGPRTEKKVKDFQKANRIDFGKPDFMDGIVGPHTHAVLESGAKVDFRVGIDPSELPGLTLPGINPLPVPPLPNPIPQLPPLKPPLVPPPAPQPPFIPAPKLHLDNIQVQAGFSHTINFTRDNTDSVFSQVQYTFLWRSEGPHTELSAGVAHLFSVNGKEDGNDIQIFGQVTRAQIPIFDKLTVSFFGQIAVQNLKLVKPLQPVVGVGGGAQFTWEFIKDRFSIGAQGMPFFNLLSEDGKFKVLTGAQGQGFLIFQFDGGKR
jgi:peptidoglycan hydrolase-like protein with peptidoglycan-binding domain